MGKKVVLLSWYYSGHLQGILRPLVNVVTQNNDTRSRSLQKILEGLEGEAGGLERSQERFVGSEGEIHHEGAIEVFRCLVSGVRLPLSRFGF